MTQKPNFRLAEDKAIALLSQTGVSQPPVNPMEIAEYLNVPVRFATFDLSESDRISGFYDCEDVSIVVNRNEFPLRQTFTIAHELGHKVLHGDDWLRSSEYQVLLRDPHLQNRDFREREADAFAANLLMPRFMMDQYYEDLNPSQLSRLFAVSVPAIRARLSFLYGI